MVTYITEFAIFLLILFLISLVVDEIKDWRKKNGTRKIQEIKSREKE